MKDSTPSSAPSPVASVKPQLDGEQPLRWRIARIVNETVLIAVSSERIAAEDGLATADAILALTADPWRPIETAPKDGTAVLTFAPGFGLGALVLFWLDGRWREPANHLGLKVAPTRWMPLPAPPRDQQVSPAIRDEQDISPAQASGFVLDTAGEVYVSGPLLRDHQDTSRWVWSDLSPFAQGYVEGLVADLNRRHRRLTREGMRPYAFSDLAAETLDRIRADCEANTREFLQPRGFDEVSRNNGRHFWALRQAGFWPTRWLPLTPTLGDDGRVYLREASQPTPTEA